MSERESSVVDDISYDEEAREMRVVFKTGRIYVYVDVPIEEYEAFESAESRGKYFNAHIRDAYDYRELS